MTETDWLECTDPAIMIRYLSRGTRDRKLWLFAVASCRRIWQLLVDQRSRDAVSTVEDFIDGRASASLLTEAKNSSRRAWRWVGYKGSPYVEAALAVRILTGLDELNRPEDVAQYARSTGEFRTESIYQAACLRDIVGNPFRPLSIQPNWLTANVVDLARTIYAQRTFDHLPILADALMDAGCDDAEVLAHCKSAGAHSRGCWLVDALHVGQHE